MQVLEGLSSGTDSVDSRIGMDSQSKGRASGLYSLFHLCEGGRGSKVREEPPGSGKVLIYFIIFMLYSELPSSRSKNRNQSSISSIFFIEIVERALVWNLVGLASVRSAKGQNILCVCDGRCPTMVGSCSIRLSREGRHTNPYTYVEHSVEEESETWC